MTTSRTEIKRLNVLFTHNTNVQWFHDILEMDLETSTMMTMFTRAAVFCIHVLQNVWMSMSTCPSVL